MKRHSETIAVYELPEDGDYLVLGVVKAGATGIQYVWFRSTLLNTVVSEYLRRGYQVMSAYIACVHYECGRRSTSVPYSWRYVVLQDIESDNVDAWLCNTERQAGEVVEHSRSYGMECEIVCAYRWMPAVTDMDVEDLPSTELSIPLCEASGQYVVFLVDIMRRGSTFRKGYAFDAVCGINVLHSWLRKHVRMPVANRGWLVVPANAGEDIGATDRPCLKYFVSGVDTEVEGDNATWFGLLTGSREEAFYHLEATGVIDGMVTAVAVTYVPLSVVMTGQNHE